MLIPPVYIASALSGLAVLLIVLKRGTQHPHENDFVDNNDYKSSINKDRLPEIIILYLIPKEPIYGADLLEFFLAHHLRYSQNKIFHLPTNDRDRFSVATLSSPGTFDLRTMAQDKYEGLSFFIQPKESPSPLEDFDALCNVIFEAKDYFNAELKSAEQNLITLDQLRELRETIAE